MSCWKLAMEIFLCVLVSNIFELLLYTYYCISSNTMNTTSTQHLYINKFVKTDRDKYSVVGTNGTISGPSSYF